VLGNLAGEQTTSEGAAPNQIATLKAVPRKILASLRPGSHLGGTRSDLDSEGRHISCPILEAYFFLM